MEKYNVEQLYSLVNSTISILKFEEAESYDGTVEQVVRGENREEDYLTLFQHENEKFFISDIDEIYLHVEGSLPVFYSPLDNYDPETFSYPPEFIEGFFDYLGQQIKVFGKFDGFYELTGTLSEVKIEDLQLVIGEYPVDLWRINLMFQVDENYNKNYISAENLIETFDEPLDNLYSEEDFDLLIGRKIRIKTMDPEIKDEVATVSGYSLAEGYSGEEVYHLELEEFPDHLLEPSEIQFIYLIGEDGSETLVEPSGGSLYNNEEDEWDEQVEETESESQLYVDFVNNIMPELRPYKKDGMVYLMWLSFSESEFNAISEAIKTWYLEGTPEDFERKITSSISVFDSRKWEGWYKEEAPAAAGLNKRPYKNFPYIIIRNTNIQGSSDEVLSNFVFYSLSDIDKLNEDFNLGLNNYHFAIGRMYEAYAPEQTAPLDFYKAAITNIQEHIKLYPRHIIGLNSIGYNLYLLGKFEQALEYFNKALEINPKWLTPIANKIDTAIELKDFDTAFKTTDIAHGLEPEHGEWEWYYAKIHSRMMNKEEARKHAEEALRRGFNTAKDLLETL